MKVSSKVAVASGLWATALLGVVGHDLVQVRRLAVEHREMAEIDLRATTLSLEQRRLLNQIDGFTRKLFVTEDEAYADRIEPLRLDFESNLSVLRNLGLDTPVTVELQTLAGLWNALPIETILNHVAARENEVQDEPTTAREPAADSEVVEPVNKDQLAELFTGISRDLQEQAQVVVEATQNQVREHAEQAVITSEQAETVSWIVAIAGLALSLPLLWLTVQSIRRPLEQLAEGTRSVAGGEYTYKVGASGTGEFEPVESSFNEMVERLSELDRAKRDFLSHVSHELKTPLAAMYETDSLLLDELPGRLTDKQRRLLELSLENNRRLEVMISKLLDLAQLEEGALQYTFGTWELNDLLAGVIENYSSLAWNRGVSLSLATVPPVALECDRDRVVQVLGNLTENAIRFAPDGSAIRIDVSTTPTPEDLEHTEPGDYAFVRIADRGPGVPEPEQERIFERFHQIRAEGHSSAGSVGLGLAIAREILTHHGGAVWVRNRQGGGAVFSIALPRAAEELRAQRAG